MDYEEMKLECLRLAIDSGATGAEVLALAAKFFDHCRGRGEGDITVIPRARVVGMDSNLERPFKDYLTPDK